MSVFFQRQNKNALLQRTFFIVESLTQREQMLTATRQQKTKTTQNSRNQRRIDWGCSYHLCPSNHWERQPMPHRLLSWQHSGSGGLKHMFSPVFWNFFSHLIHLFSASTRVSYLSCTCCGIFAENTWWVWFSHSWWRNLIWSLTSEGWSWFWFQRSGSRFRFRWEESFLQFL